MLRLKELEISKLEIEVEALRIVAPLLADNGESGHDRQLASVPLGLRRRSTSFPGSECQPTTDPLR